MKHCALLPLAALLLGLAAGGDEGGFRSLFDGKTLGGWRPVNEPGHGSGTLWRVRDGAIEATQQWPGAWGLLVSEGKYGDFELRADVRCDGPIDGGLILRTTPEGHGYQVLVQPRPGGEVGAIAPSRIGEYRAAAPEWKKAWKKDDWNELRATVRGSPPEIRTWLNGTPMAQLRAPAIDDRRLGATGHVALKVHGPNETLSNHVLYRNVRVLELK